MVADEKIVTLYPKDGVTEDIQYCFSIIHALVHTLLLSKKLLQQIQAEEYSWTDSRQALRIWCSKYRKWNQTKFAVQSLSIWKNNFFDYWMRPSITLADQLFQIWVGCVNFQLPTCAESAPSLSQSLPSMLEKHHWLLEWLAESHLLQQLLHWLRQNLLQGSRPVNWQRSLKCDAIQDYQ